MLPLLELIRKEKAEHSSTNSSVSKGRHSRTLKQQGAFLNTKNSLKEIRNKIKSCLFFLDGNT
tara:strand:+ start:101 stop:289 length:189 start_codon:yes stop_codon:yes gene_type:complete